MLGKMTEVKTRVIRGALIMQKCRLLSHGGAPEDVMLAELLFDIVNRGDFGTENFAGKM